jgi:hypothetical protein
VVIARKRAQVPISGLLRDRIRITKLTSPKNVREKRCIRVKKAERIQYEERYFFKGEYLKWVTF